jgi:OOP family OmpA-OmpF porin
VRDGVDSSCFISWGRGPDNPIADNDTAEGRNLNRRVEVRYDLADDGAER